MRTWIVLTPGFCVVRPASEMCRKRISALQLYFLRRRCRPAAPPPISGPARHESPPDSRRAVLNSLLEVLLMQKSNLIAAIQF